MSAKRWFPILVVTMVVVLILTIQAGFAVLKVKAKGHRDLVTVVGSLASVTSGEWVTAEGRWIQDREYGQQFRAEMLTSTAPIF